MKARFSATAALVCATLAWPAVGQDDPQVIAPEDRWVAVNDYPMPDAEEPKADSGSPIIRRAMPDRGLETVFTAEDGFVARWLASEEKRGGFYLGLRIASDGSIVECAGDRLEASDDPDIVEACAIVIERARFVPTLAADGSTLADEVEVWVRAMSGKRYSKQTGPVIAHSVIDLGSSSPPPPPPTGVFWPYRRDTGWWRMPRKTKIEPKVAVAGTIPADAKWAGGDLSDEPADRKCVIKATSITDEVAAEAFEREVCAWSEKEFKPRWDRARQYNNVQPFVFVERGETFDVFRPGLEEGTRAAIPGSAAAAAIAKLLSFIAKETQDGPIWKPELRLRTDGEGEVSHCEIAETSGNNAVDVEACRILREDVAIEPATDIFGLPTYGFLYFRFGRKRD